MAGPPLSEFSAGGVICKPSPSGPLVALVMDSYGIWTFPKGKMERGESAEQAAMREIGEEIGLTGLRPVAVVGESKYRFLAEGRLVRKRVTWLLFAAPPEAVIHPQEAERIYDGGWFRPDTALRLLGYRNLKRILRIALAALPQQ